MARTSKTTPEASLHAELAQLDKEIGKLMDRRERVAQSLLLLSGEPPTAPEKARRGRKPGVKKAAAITRKTGTAKPGRSEKTVEKTGALFFLNLMKENTSMGRQEILAAALKKLKAGDSAEAKKVIAQRLDAALPRLITAGGITSEGRGRARTYTRVPQG